MHKKNCFEQNDKKRWKKYKYSIPSYYTFQSLLSIESKVAINSIYLHDNMDSLRNNLQLLVTPLGTLLEAVPRFLRCSFFIIHIIKIYTTIIIVISFGIQTFLNFYSVIWCETFNSRASIVNTFLLLQIFLLSHGTLQKKDNSVLHHINTDSIV